VYKRIDILLYYGACIDGLAFYCDDDLIEFPCSLRARLSGDWIRVEDFVAS
jgi:hypothetical protein